MKKKHLQKQLNKPVTNTLPSANKTITQKNTSGIPTVEEQQQLLAVYNQGEFQKSLIEAEAFIENYPNHKFGWKIYGGALQHLGRKNMALFIMKRAFEIAPEDKEICNSLSSAYVGLGLSLRFQNKFQEAEKNYRKALEISPYNVAALNNLGVALGDQRNFQAAEENFLLALKLQENYLPAHFNLSGQLLGARLHGKAKTAYRNFLTAFPDVPAAVAGYVYVCKFICDWSSELTENIKKLTKCFESKSITFSNSIPPFQLLSVENITPSHIKQAGKTFAEKNFYQPDVHVSKVLHNSNTHHKLRIGYLSADFHNHATIHLMAGVLENRNKENFDVYLYSYGVEQRSAERSRVENACEVFRNVRSLSDEEIANQIVADEIDILVDLKGYTTDTRLGVQAFRPAPVIVSWLGYPATLGHERLADYIIGDATVTPLEHAENFSETLALMPHCYQPNDNTRLIGTCPTRAEVGLPENGFVFATFNQSYKITPEMFDIWCKLLAAVPNSVLWILQPHEVAQENLRREMEARGVDSSRLIFAAKREQTEHLGRLQLTDLALDTFPYTSHTTASDALWVGVPLVTKMGGTFASRVAASILCAMNLAELVTDNDDDYFNVALNLAQNSEKLAAIKQKIAYQKQISPLFDTQKFAHDLERLYQAIWEQELRNERKVVVLVDR